MENNKETFTFTYSAKQQEEVARIRKKYAAPEEDKMAQLRRLDRSVTDKATMISIVVGVIGALILGIGMCCAMVWMGALFIPGIVIGIVGIAIVSLAYPLYNRTLKKERAKIAPEIIRLTDELMK
ncbi:MAG: hypothetical protein IJ002_00645 [Clostridia bacterium]|nr:hypothetical protein [Clostridia bacterium]